MKELTTEIRQQISDFLQSPGGDYFAFKLDDMINLKHIEAEKSGESARDLVQQAKGIRDAKHQLTLLGRTKK